MTGKIEAIVPHSGHARHGLAGAYNQVEYLKERQALDSRMLLECEV